VFVWLYSLKRPMATTHPLAAVSRPASSLSASCASGPAVEGAPDRMSAAAAPAAAAASASPVSSGAMRG
jgi:hypothetical protein